ncbi:DUF6924 domain-containing protein [Myceligenerans pegani]|uniref:DUF6924 domain-containing protein n=1 Tax=Myceligenerans pegani TaxID=2776917 RepID=A0ABR9MYX8_9MICO|nr:hypothetical protein [Myceligenerans sp. TRM 65318]MBE1876605.1 hypothetical protein [Myceligenerans sp. TRM 65318]MBE3018876.1 hypothetical protein [Myceligenerans sp. TRM 65318]
MNHHHPKLVPPVDELDLSGVLIRTDYSNDARFAQVLENARRQVGSSPTDRARLLVVDDPHLARIEPGRVADLVEVESFAFVADARSMADRTLLVVDLYEDSDTYLETFRVAPEAVFTVEANLAIANLDFDDFASQVDNDGVYREAIDNGDVR